MYYRSKLARIGLTLSIVLMSPAHARIIYYHNDGLGSPVLASDEQGQVLWRSAYRPHGGRAQTAQDHLQSTGNQRWYTGHVHDEHTALTYMQARYYDPLIGRFISTDPQPVRAAQPGTFNRYAYASNNPYRYYDPDGEDSLMLSWRLSAVAGVGGNLGSGIYVTFPGQDAAPWDAGYVSYVSGSLGADVSASLNVSQLHGGRENIEGTSVVAGVTVPVTGPAGLAVDYQSIVNPETGEWAGQSVGVGAALFPSMSASYTVSSIGFSMRDWLSGQTEAMPASEASANEAVAEPTQEELMTWYGFIN